MHFILFLCQKASSFAFFLKGTFLTASQFYGLSVFDSLFTHQPRVTFLITLLTASINLD